MRIKHLLPTLFTSKRQCARLFVEQNCSQCNFPETVLKVNQPLNRMTLDSLSIFSYIMSQVINPDGYQNTQEYTPTYIINSWIHVSKILVCSGQLKIIDFNVIENHSKQAKNEKHCFEAKKLVAYALLGLNKLHWRFFISLV